VDWTVMYTARGKVGPFLASGTVDHGPLGRHVARMRLVDRGNADRLVATALAVFMPI
jgi:acyl-coenzyme A thioesterase PaaI-like protein